MILEILIAPAVMWIALRLFMPLARSLMCSPEWEVYKEQHPGRYNW